MEGVKREEVATSQLAYIEEISDEIKSKEEEIMNLNFALEKINKRYEVL